MCVLDYISHNVAKDIGALRMKSYMMCGTAEMDCIRYSLI